MKEVILIKWIRKFLILNVKQADVMTIRDIRQACCNPVGQIGIIPLRNKLQDR